VPSAGLANEDAYAVEEILESCDAPLVRLHVAAGYEVIPEGF
jgi:hypothetical protein